jgi:hypothetical protein
MAQGIVTAPDGAQWRVRRRWMDRPLPDLRRRFKANRKEVHAGNALDGLSGLDLSGALDASSPALAIAAVILMLLVVFVLLPLLGVALELIALVFLLGSGLIGRVLLGRPWIVEATKIDDPEERAAYAVEGWRQSSEALQELRTAIATAGPPDRPAFNRDPRRGV